MADLPTIFTDSIRENTCLALVLSKKLDSTGATAERVSLRPVVVGGQDRFQFTSRIANQDHHENLDTAGTIERLGELWGLVFRHGHLFTASGDYSARVGPDGNVKVKKSPPTRQAAGPDHNRAKKYLIPEGQPVDFLVAIGVMTASGRVRAKKRQKFRQINRFLELVDEIHTALPREGTVNIVDFGCGKSYLTFALYHLFRFLRNRDVHIVGLDRSPQVIRDCSQISERLGCEGLEFAVGEIATHEPEAKVHLAVSLHACDTATDDALAKAVGWQTDVILAAPCCQHELAPLMRSNKLAPLFEHGILKQRFAALATDALRARVLENCGYKTQVVEFIDMEHTAKNLLIRAVRRHDSQHTSEEKVDAYQEFKELLGLEQIYLENAFSINLGREPSDSVGGLGS
jgi:hypothetical protein